MCTSPRPRQSLGVILMPDNKDQQNPYGTNLQAGVHETNHVDVDAKHVSTLKRAVTNSTTGQQDPQQRDEECRH